MKATQSDLFGNGIAENDDDVAPQKKRVGFIDGDIVGYRACWGGTETVHFEEDDEGLELADLNKAKRIFSYMIKEIVDTLQLDEVVVCYSGKDNFRKKAVPFYKSNRTTPKPVLLAPLKDWSTKHFKTAKYEAIEADDLIGIECTRKVVGEERIAVSIDKDFLSVPINFYDFKKKIMHRTTWLEAFRNLCMQICKGDAVDGFSGLKGYGEKKTKIYLDEVFKNLKNVGDRACYVAAVFQEMISKFKEVYGEEINGEDLFWANTQCAYILRGEDYDAKARRIRLIDKHNFVFAITQTLEGRSQWI